MYVQMIWEFNIDHKKNSIYYPVEQSLVQLRTLSGNMFHSLLAWYRNEWRP